MNDSDYVDRFPGRAQCLSQVIEGSEIAAVTRAALDAVDVLRFAWEPLSAEASLFGVEGDNPWTALPVEVARPHRLLVKASVDPGVLVNAMMIDPVITTEDELSRHAIEVWLESALRDVIAGDGRHGEWSQLRFDAGRAWVGPAGWRSGEADLRLHYEAGTVVVPIERALSGAWLSGPRDPASDQPPISVRLTNQEGLVTLQLTRHYGYWLESREPAAQRLDEIVDRLRAMGWASDTAT
jgi:hypothetical protein